MNKISHKLQVAMMSVVVGLGAMTTSAEAQIDQLPIVTAHEGFGMGDHREGDLVTFEVVRSQHGIDAPLDVQVNVSQRGNVLLPADVGNKTLHFDAWADLAYIDLDTIDDQIDEADGSLTFSIRSGSGYRLGSPTRLSTNVRDDDVPSVSIQASTTSVQAGRSTVFRLSRNGITRTASTVSLDVSQEGAVLTDAARAISTVQFRSGQSSATLSLATKSTAGAGKVFVAVLPGEDYASDIGNGYATVNVTASSAQLPVVSFMDADETIIEGQPASFEVRRNAAVSTPLTVSMQFRASRSGVIGAGTFTTMNVTIPAWSTQGTASRRHPGQHDARRGRHGESNDRRVERLPDRNTGHEDSHGRRRRGHHCPSHQDQPQCGAGGGGDDAQLPGDPNRTHITSAGRSDRDQRNARHGDGRSPAADQRHDSGTLDLCVVPRQDPQRHRQ